MGARAVCAADLVYARTLEHRRRVAAAQQRLTDALARGRFGVSWSGGKDSTVVLALLRARDPTAPAALFDSGVELPETYTLAAQLGVAIITPRLSAREIAHYVGWWGAPAPVDRGCPFDVKAVLIEEPAETFVVRARLTGLAVGLRAEESRARRWVSRRQGPLYRARNRTWYVLPLLDWTADDVWAYIAAQELPYHPAYDRMAALGLPRARWRLGLALDATPEALGSLVVLRRIAPAWFADLAAEFPGLRESA